MVENKETGTNPLRNALQTFRAAFSVEADLVRPSAEKHHVPIIEGNILTPIKDRGYNPRVPEGTIEEIEAIIHADSIAFICEDYRQSLDVANELKPSVLVSTAGGPVQPDYTRLSAMVNLIKEIQIVNPDIKINLVSHNGICGGCKHFTKGENVTIREEQGIEGENDFMKDLTMELIDELDAANVSLSTIKIYRADINEKDEFAGLTPIPFT